MGGSLANSFHASWSIRTSICIPKIGLNSKRLENAACFSRGAEGKVCFNIGLFQKWVDEFGGRLATGAKLVGVDPLLLGALTLI